MEILKRTATRHLLAGAGKQRLYVQFHLNEIRRKVSRNAPCRSAKVPVGYKAREVLTKTIVMGIPPLYRRHSSVHARSKWKKCDLTFLNGESAVAFEHMFKKWLSNPDSVDKSWWEVFQAIRDNAINEEGWITKGEVPSYQKVTAAAPFTKISEPERNEFVEKPEVVPLIKQSTIGSTTQSQLTSGKDDTYVKREMTSTEEKVGKTIDMKRDTIIKLPSKKNPATTIKQSDRSYVKKSPEVTKSKVDTAKPSHVATISPSIDGVKDNPSLYTKPKAFTSFKPRPEASTGTKPTDSSTLNETLRRVKDTPKLNPPESVNQSSVNVKPRNIVESIKTVAVDTVVEGKKSPAKSKLVETVERTEYTNEGRPIARTADSSAQHRFEHDPNASKVFKDKVSETVPAAETSVKVEPGDNITNEFDAGKTATISPHVDSSFNAYPVPDRELTDDSTPEPNPDRKEAAGIIMLNLKPGAAIKPVDKLIPPSEPIDSNKPSSSGLPDELEEHIKVQLMVRGYQTYGHLSAAIDPLHIWRTNQLPIVPAELEKKVRDPHQKNVLYLIPEETFVGMGEEFLTIGDIVNKLHNVYCRTVGVEFVHMMNSERRAWITELVEKSLSGLKIQEYDKSATLKSLLRAYLFEVFVNEMKPEKKKNDLEGCEVLIPALEMLIELGTENGAETFNIGMSHRGRTNVLANILKVGVNEIFNKMTPVQVDNIGSGDRVLHMGTSARLKCKKTGKEVDVCLAPGPAYFEAAHALVQGRTRAQQFHTDDLDGSKVWPVAVHGDSTIYSQGLGYELLQMSELPSYNTHGTIHFIIGNQIGYYTLTRMFKNTEYCSDIGKVIGAPIFHVNGDDVDAVMDIVSKAVQYRMKFKADAIVDIVCYRRYGMTGRHIPVDFQQQLMYDKIVKMKTVYQKYCNQLVNEKVITPDEIFKMEKSYFDELYRQLKIPLKSDSDVSGLWADNVSWWNYLKKKSDARKGFNTGVEIDRLKHIAKVVSTIPHDFHPNRSIERLIRQRGIMMKKNKYDWCFCEALAIGSLLMDGHHVRLSGEDVERGTFSHRNQVWYDILVPGASYNPLLNLEEKQADYTLSNSLLSESAVLGYEFGYSTFNPNDLVMWEAQFGDFLNSAQVMVDNYIAAAEIRWSTKSSLVLLLPHGMEGQGPEHSSGRPERILQLSSDDDRELVEDPESQLARANVVVACPTLPGNYFHLLRRQAKMPHPKPLAVFTPKSLLRYPPARSPIEAMGPATEFQTYIPDAEVDPSKVKKLIMCTGKVYYELATEREVKGLMQDVAIGRVEQVCPFPFHKVKQDIVRFPKAQLCWAQEEHKNQGWWTYTEPRIMAAIGGVRKGALRKVTYVGRKRAAAPAAGNKLMDLNQKEEYLEKAMAVA